MSITPDQYEKPGTFYLGRSYDLQKHQIEDDLILYDSRDLVTHGVVLGMTGSGKTGLCLALLEEAAMDGIPVIAIDPKGDIGNAMLTFPDLSASDFKPWVNPDDARRKNVSVDEFAESQANLWKKGLAEWGQSGERIRQLREKTEVSIYTPGSSAGLPVSILSSLSCPPPAVLEDSEATADRVESTASSLLGLIGVDADPVQSAEHVLLSNIMGHCWRKGQNLTLENLIRFVQQPPFRTVGVVDVDTFCPEEKRTALAMKLNNMIASPGFASWLEGEPLDIQRMFFTAEGKPRISIFNIAHLNDSERMFFVSLLLNQLLGWMRSQQGTTSLRALLYMDEVFGFLPPSAMPPSKKPMLLLLKQARAFGLGVLLATQNPVDLDYKALSNIGTWWLGRLQTERDKARVLDGLEGAAAGSAGFDRREMDVLLSSLDTRVFVMNNVHEDAPVVFHVRWVMAYMSGPFARDQIKRLMDPVRGRSRSAATAAAVPAEDAGFIPPGVASAATSSGNTVKPALPDGVAEFFLPTDIEAGRLRYVPTIIRSATVAFDDARRGISGSSSVTLVNPIDVGNQRVLWDQFSEVPRDVDLNDFEREQREGAEFADLPGAALKSSTYTGIKKDFGEWVYANHKVHVFFSPLLKAYSSPGEKMDEFRMRVSQKARELRDAAVDELREKTAKSVRTLQDRAARASTKVDTQKSQAHTATITSALNIGTSLLGAVLGRKKGLASVFKSTNVHSAGRVQRESREAAAAQAELQRIQQDLKDLEQQASDETQRLRDQYDPTSLVLETVSLSPQKKNIQVIATGILWLAAER